MNRTEFGFTRTTCACPACSAHCESMPGFLVPSDLPRMAGTEQPADIMAWAQENLLASPGAVVANVETGRVFRIPTLVPARADNDHCRARGGGNLTKGRKVQRRLLRRQRDYDTYAQTKTGSDAAAKKAIRKPGSRKK
jgi:hypothetical protein